jgi:hypothetical protein
VSVREALLRVPDRRVTEHRATEQQVANTAVRRKKERQLNRCAFSAQSRVRGLHRVAKPIDWWPKVAFA